MIVELDDSDETTASYQIITAVAGVIDHPVESMPPLNHAFDADALDTLLSSADGPLEVRFQYAGCWVQIEDASLLVVSPVRLSDSEARAEAPE